MLGMYTGRRAWSRRLALSLLAMVGMLVLPAAAAAQAERQSFFEETAAATARWRTSAPTARSSQARLLVQSTLTTSSAPDTSDAEPTARVQYQRRLSAARPTAGRSPRAR